MYLDLYQPVHQNSPHLGVDKCENTKKNLTNLFIDGTALQMVCFNSTEGFHSSENKVNSQLQNLMFWPIDVMRIKVKMHDLNSSHEVISGTEIGNQP